MRAKANSRRSAVVTPEAVLATLAAVLFGWPNKGMANRDNIYIYNIIYPEVNNLETVSWIAGFELGPINYQFQKNMEVSFLHPDILLLLLSLLGQNSY